MRRCVEEACAVVYTELLLPGTHRLSPPCTIYKPKDESLTLYVQYRGDTDNSKGGVGICDVCMGEVLGHMGMSSLAEFNDARAAQVRDRKWERRKRWLIPFVFGMLTWGAFVVVIHLINRGDHVAGEVGK